MFLEKGLFSFLEIDAIYVIKAFLILFLFFYVIFSLIIYRQIQVMSKILPTPFTPYLKFIGIIQIGISLGLLFITLGVL